MKDEQEPVMNGWLWSLLAAACFFGLGNIVYGAEKKQPLEVIVAAFERCMDTEGSCKDKARPVTIDGIKGVALDVRDERGEPLQCAILELKGERSFGVIRRELVPGSRKWSASNVRRVFVGVSREGYLEGALIESVGKVEAWELPFTSNFPDRERAAHECFEAAWASLIPAEDKAWAKMQKHSP